jgi:hypothetical protein
MPPSKFQKKRDRRAKALERLRQTWEEGHEGEEWEADNEPVVSPMLQAVQGGIPPYWLR